MGELVVEVVQQRSDDREEGEAGEQLRWDDPGAVEAAVHSVCCSSADQAVEAAVEQKELRRLVAQEEGEEVQWVRHLTVFQEEAAVAEEVEHHLR